MTLLAIRKATPADLDMVLALVMDAVRWLASVAPTSGNTRTNVTA